MSRNAPIFGMGLCHSFPSRQQKALPALGSPLSACCGLQDGRWQPQLLKTEGGGEKPEGTVLKQRFVTHGYLVTLSWRFV